MGLTIGKVGAGSNIGDAGGSVTANWTGGGSSAAGSWIVAHINCGTADSITVTAPAGSITVQSNSTNSVVYLLPNWAAITGLTISYTGGSASPVHLKIIEIQPLSGFVSRSQLATAATGTSTTPTTNSITTVLQNELMIALYGIRRGTATPWTLSTPTNSFAIVGTNTGDTDGTVSLTSGAYSRAVSSVTTTSTGVTSSGSGAWAAQLLSLFEDWITKKPAAVQFDPDPVPDVKRVLSTALKTRTAGNVQANSSRFARSSSPQSLAYTSNVTRGNLLVCVVGAQLSGTTGSSTVALSDNCGHLWQQAGSYQSQHGGTVSIWYTTASASGALTVSIIPDSNVSMGIGLFEESGYQAAVDGTSANSSASDLEWSTGPISLTAPNELVIAAFQNNDVGNSWTAHNGMTARVGPSDTGVDCGIYANDVEASSPFLGAGTHSNNQPYTAVGASFKAGAALTPLFSWIPRKLPPIVFDPEPPQYERPRRYVFTAADNPPTPSSWFPLRKSAPAREPDPWQEEKHRAYPFTEADNPAPPPGNLWIPLRRPPPMPLEPEPQPERSRFNTAAWASGGVGPTPPSAWFPGRRIERLRDQDEPPPWFARAMETVLKSATSPLVQSTSARLNQLATAQSLAYTSNVTLGDTLIAAVSTFRTFDAGDPRPTTLTLADTQGNHWYQAGGTPAGYSSIRGSTISLWYAVATSTGACTLTVLPNETAWLAIGLFEYAGIKAAVDGFVQNNASGGGITTYWETGIIPVNYPNELVIAAFANNDVVSPSHQRGGFLERENPLNFPRAIVLYVEDLLGSAPLDGVSIRDSAQYYVAVGASFFRGANVVPPALPAFDTNLIPWDNQASPVSRRHEQQVAEILNGLKRLGLLGRVDPTDPTLWRLLFTATAPANWSGGSAPNTLSAALDRIAAALTTAGFPP